MSNQRSTIRLKEVSRLITKGTTPTTLGHPFTEQGVNYVKSESITPDGQIDRSKFAFIDASTHHALKRSILAEGDILFSMAGVYIGKTAVVPSDILPANTNQAVGIIRLDTTHALPRYVDYFLRNKSYNAFINNLVAQSAQPNLNLGDIGNLPIVLPPLPEQRAIAHILGTLDDKIELNRRMNETLEAMAQALFKSWFVDFDPVRAKMEGRQPVGMDAETAALFPDRLVDSEIGEIPEGWGVASLPQLIDVNPTRSLKKGALAPYLDMANMPTRGHSPDTVVDRPFGSGMKFINGDTLVARITPCLENGKTAFVDFLKNDQVGWGSTEYIVLRPRSPLSEEFGYCLARSGAFRDFAIQSMTGSSGRQRVPAESLSHFLLASPSEEVAKVFGSLVRPLFVRAGDLSRESRTLGTVRDALLPKLLSGEVSPQTIARQK